MTHEDGGAAAEPTNAAGATAADHAADDSRTERLDRHATPGPRNSLWSWPDAKSPLVVVRNYVVIVLARVCPSLRLKNWLLRRIGVAVGTGVAWGLESTPDVFWPERITVGDDAIVGYDATLLCHEFLSDEYRLGDVVVEEGAMIGAGAVVLPGVTVGEGAQVAANSLVAADVPPETTVAGVPAEVVSRAADGEKSADQTAEPAE
ncbi:MULTISPECIES: acyltransferase [unclassified Halorubrum]|uniref:acyltransferase n=1 Tax=unclassified Halorubrum TaxID=2642239 RepID=UPI000B98609D|nr:MULTISPECIES: acyltransferase [unclassified Halorubrum]OYR41575.1 acetyltransferase [Halorubrum sp. Hd13]OYR43224.1 acetyltransferase [Halorubrum sp. Eb13]OYR50255.1 acetyltransferase [Halorubrum sp. Ea1]OYR52176.1 acetyltransferase [Halorubrum sp. Ea8]